MTQLRSTRAFAPSVPYRVLTALILTVSLLFVGCDSGGSNGENDVDNQFTFTIEPTSSSSATVEQQEEVSGFSFFVEGEDTETEEEVFAVYLDDEESFSNSSTSQEGLFGWIALDASQPSAGEYSFNSDANATANQFGAVLWEDIQNTQTAPLYVIEGGTLDLSESSDEKVVGSVDATGTKVTITSSGATEEPVTITGSFTAEDIDTFVDLTSPGV